MQLAIRKQRVDINIWPVVDPGRCLPKPREKVVLARTLTGFGVLPITDRRMCLTINLSARSCCFIQQDHPCAAAGCLHSRGQSRRASADDSYRPPHGSSPCWRTTFMSGRTSVIQARTSALPSMLHRHSQHTPMAQTTPFGRPASSMRRYRSPAAIKAAATLWPLRAETGRPSKKN